MADSPPFAWIDAAAVEQMLSYPRLFAAIEKAFVLHPALAPRTSLSYQGQSDHSSGTLLVMSAIQPDTLAGVKIITHNVNRSSGIISYIYVAIDPVSGAPIALIDGETLSTRRTAAVSVVASRHLARENPGRILIIGTGPVARQLVAAYGTAYPNASLQLWGRRPQRVQLILDSFANGAVRVDAAGDLDRSLRGADIVSCATGSFEPIVKGELLRPGAHVDLIGGFTPTMREADDAVFRRADRVVTDSVRALQEAGDLCQPIASGALRADCILSLEELLAAPTFQRTDIDALTVFKSVGNAVFDLAAAGLAIEHLRKGT